MTGMDWQPVKVKVTTHNTINVYIEYTVWKWNNLGFLDTEATVELLTTRLRDGRTPSLLKSESNIVELIT